MLVVFCIFVVVLVSALPTIKASRNRDRASPEACHVSSAVLSIRTRWKSAERDDNPCNRKLYPQF